MERSDNKDQSGDDGIAIASSRFPTTARLVGAIRREDPAAVRELFTLYRPLLRDQARIMSIPPGDEDSFVTTLLDNVVIHLIESGKTPRNLAQYLVASLRNRARNVHRDRNNREMLLERSYTAFDSSTQRVVAECHSEYGIRATSAVSADVNVLQAAIAKLASYSAAALEGADLTLMVSVARHRPLREVAEEIGISYANARVRLHRLRARFAKLAIQYTASLEAEEKSEIERFFRRAGVKLVEEGRASASAFSKNMITEKNHEG